jgi:hypothetical protein
MDITASVHEHGYGAMELSYVEHDGVRHRKNLPGRYDTIVCSLLWAAPVGNNMILLHAGVKHTLTKFVTEAQPGYVTVYSLYMCATQRMASTLWPPQPYLQVLPDSHSGHLQAAAGEPLPEHLAPAHPSGPLHNKTQRLVMLSTCAVVVQEAVQVLDGLGSHSLHV